MIVDITRIAASVSRLRFGLSEGLISESLLYHKPLVPLLHILEVLSNLVLSWQRHTAIPLGGLNCQQVAIYFILYNLPDHSRFRVGVRVSIEELVFHRVVELPILNAANSLTSAISARIGTNTHYILACAR